MFVGFTCTRLLVLLMYGVQLHQLIDCYFYMFVSQGFLTGCACNLLRCTYSFKSYLVHVLLIYLNCTLTLFTLYKYYSLFTAKY